MVEFKKSDVDNAVVKFSGTARIFKQPVYNLVLFDVRSVELTSLAYEKMERSEINQYLAIFANSSTKIRSGRNGVEATAIEISKFSVQRSPCRNMKGYTTTPAYFLHAFHKMKM